MVRTTVVIPYYEHGYKTMVRPWLSYHGFGISTFTLVAKNHGTTSDGTMVRQWYDIILLLSYHGNCHSTIVDDLSGHRSNFTMVVPW